MEWRGREGGRMDYGTHDKRSIPLNTLCLVFNHFEFFKYLSSLSSAISSHSTLGDHPPHGATQRWTVLIDLTVDGELTSTSQTLKQAFQAPPAIAPCVPLNPLGEKARHPVPSSNPSRVWRIVLVVRSNILMGESWPPLGC